MLFLGMPSCVKNLSFTMPNHHFSSPDRSRLPLVESLKTKQRSDSPDTPSPELRRSILEGHSMLSRGNVTEVLITKGGIVSEKSFNAITERADMKDTSAFALNTNVGLVDKLDLVVDLAPSYGTLLGLKYQVITPENEKFFGGVLASLQIHGNVQEDSADFFVQSTDLQVGFPYKGNLKASMWGYVVSVGYPLFADTLLYLSYFTDHYRMNADLRSAVRTIELNGLARNRVINLGLKLDFGNSGNFFVECGQAVASYEHAAQEKRGITGAAGLGLHF